MVSLPADAPTAEIVRRVIESGHSRYPVHGEDPDEIIGSECSPGNDGHPRFVEKIGRQRRGVVDVSPIQIADTGKYIEGAVGWIAVDPADRVQGRHEPGPPFDVGPVHHLDLFTGSLEGGNRRDLRDRAGV